MQGAPWGTLAQDGSITNYVLDPQGNETAHVFRSVGATACGFFETQTKFFSGTHDTGVVLKTVDTHYLADTGYNTTTSFPAYVVPDTIKTTLPGNLVSQTVRAYGPNGSSSATYGKVTSEKIYDFGLNGPGPLLREAVTTYQWQVNSAYLNAGFFDLPASVVIRDGTGCAVAATDYTYDEANFLTAYTGTLPTGTHAAAPGGGIRGNLTTVTKWLAGATSCNPRAGTPIVTHTNWYDTGEVYKTQDPPGHTTTLTYDSAYGGAFATQTCSPSTANNSVAHCVSGTYDSITGLLTTFTNENATTQASGSSPGDAAHTTAYTYDSSWRLTSGVAPPDAANQNLQAHTLFTYSSSAPFNIRRQKSITGAFDDTFTTYVDGIARPIHTEHATPNGPSIVMTTFDGLGQTTSVTNPYYAVTDPTYGVTNTAYDGLGRPTQVQPPDGPALTAAGCPMGNLCTSYSGNATTVTDQAGKARRTVTDALGRLVEVDEPGVPSAFVANNSASLATDGNFAVFGPAPANDIKWQTNTHGATNTVYGINVQDDGNVIKYTPTYSSALPTTTGTATYGSWGCIGYKIFTNQTLASGQCLQSPNNRFLLIMQTAGNLVLYDMSYSPGVPIFYSGSTGVPGSHAVMQGDGNLVVYTPSNTVYWSTGTVTGTANYMLQLQDQGNLVIYKDIWETGTVQSPNNGTLSAVSCSIQGNTLGMGSNLPMGSCLTSPSGRFALNMQSDGNLVLYDRTSNPASAIWSTGTQLTPIDPIVAMKTLYFYDALSNLYCVEQHGNATGGTGCPGNPPSAPIAPDPNNAWRRRLFGYDSLSRLLWASNPESGIIQYAYDLDSNLLQKTSPAPNQTGSATQTISYCYDELNRVTGKAYSPQTCQGTQLPTGTAVVSYTYDSGTNAKGHLTHVADQAGTADYSYDVLGRLASETRVISGISKTISYEYNLDGSVKTLHYPSGAAITYTPDSAGRVLQAVDSANSINYATSATYQADGQMTGLINGNGGGFTGITNTFSYNKRLQPINMSASAPSQTVFSIGYDFHFGNGNNGNVYNIYNYRDRNRDQAFAYDSLNRLTSAQNAGTNCAAGTINGKTEYWGNTYAYDAWGNLTTKSITKCSAENMSLAVGANNWISTAGYGYDSAGNMTADPTDGGIALTYDPENRITGAAGYTYTYDADGNRVKKSNGSTGTLYWYMTAGIIGESDLSGTMKSEYVFFNGQRVARRDLVAPAGVFYYFSDHLKTASVITDSAGNIKADSDYYPWGGELQFTNADSNHYKFTGKERDTESQLDYFGARYYSNGLGRFISADWSATPVPVPYATLTDPQTLNLYSYVTNNPSNRVDPLGHDWFNVNNKWQWQKGHKFVDPKTHKVLSTHGYRYLLEFTKTGTNKTGAATGTLTLHDQNKVVLQSQAFSGGNGFNIIPNGNFTIRLDLRGNANSPSALKANQEELRQFYGIQTIAPSITDKNGEPGDFRWEWGSIRAALNEPPGERRGEYQGNYLHGKERPGDYTHGCICERSERILHYLYQNVDPATDSKVPVSVH